MLCFIDRQVIPVLRCRGLSISLERGCRLTGTTQQRLNPRHQLTWAERLGEVVICANGQAEEFVDLFSTRS